MSKNHCGKCAFFELLDRSVDPSVGVCHRYPPSVAGKEVGEMYYVGVDAHLDWCGEFKRAKVAIKDDSA